MKASTHLAHGTCKAARGGREGKSSLVRGTRTRLGEGEFLRKKSLYRRMYMAPQDLRGFRDGQKKLLDRPYHGKVAFLL